ncbi:MAG: sigma-54 dependent transcriptional regulator [Gammaproteobacteria bacterium]|nr:sigma-54 dependent transcriptional regulator [Gammaproteobacteria bacterium]MCF6261220.1 sigma-54 dependent transcriptional regulator [Gammaproteobacteria bacterium]
MPDSMTLLLVEDNDQQRQKFAVILEFVAQGAVNVTDSSRALDFLDDRTEAVLLGNCGSTERLVELFNEIKKKSESTPIVLFLAEDSDRSLDKNMVQSAFAMLNLPLRYSELSDLLQRAEVFNLGRKRGGGGGVNLDLFRSLVGNSRGVIEVRKLIEQVANSEATVLILGESGTGKEVVARNLHYHSVRRDKPFVPINCGAIPGELLESELFGHEKGAFTGAISARRGRFEMAEGGTLFLDEIGDMPMSMQVKLLRVLQERTFERVGGNKELKADVRVIAATHQNLEELIKDGSFREDLYYRLNVFPIDMPPLRERMDDVPLLVNELIARMENEKRGSVRFTPAAMIALCQYRWPGNVRELSNLLERMVIMYPYGIVDVADLPEKFRPTGTVSEDAPSIHFEQHLMPSADFQTSRLPREGIDLKEHISSMECSLIKQALDDAGGVVAHAAKRLKMRRTTLVEKLRKYGLQRTETMTEI